MSQMSHIIVRCEEAFKKRVKREAKRLGTTMTEIVLTGTKAELSKRKEGGDEG